MCVIRLEAAFCLVCSVLVENFVKQLNIVIPSVVTMCEASYPYVMMACLVLRKRCHLRNHGVDCAAYGSDASTRRASKRARPCVCVCGKYAFCALALCRKNGNDVPLLYCTCCQRIFLESELSGCRTTVPWGRSTGLRLRGRRRQTAINGCSHCFGS